MNNKFLPLYIFTFFAGMISESYAQGNAPLFNESAEGLRDVHAPIYFSQSPLLMIALVMIILILAGIAMAYFLRKRKIPVEEKIIDTRTPYEITYQQLSDLAKSSFLDQGQFKEYYSRLSDIVRQFFEHKFNVRAPEMTSEEFLWSIEESNDLTAHQRGALKKFMASCDIVKFAKYIPKVEEGNESFLLAKNLVDEIRIADKRDQAVDTE